MRHLDDDYYAVLGVDPKVSRDELRAAWQRLALLWHPDRAGNEATATFRRIMLAYSASSLLACGAARRCGDHTFELLANEDEAAEGGTRPE